MAPCAICGSTSVRRSFDLERYAVVQCGTCTGEFLDPQPDDAALAAIYTADYFFARDDEADRDRHAYLKSGSARKTLDLLPKPAPGTKLLDIGCGTGDFLCEAAAYGYAVTGVEYSETSAATAAARVPGTIVRGDIDSAALATASFDVVANSDVIEHVRRPLAFAREIRRILKPGGIALISTPDLDSWSHKVLGNRWVEYKAEHLTYLNRMSLTLVLREAGFTNLSFTPNVKVLSAAYIAAHFEKFPVPFWTPLTQTLTNALPENVRHRPFSIVASGITVKAS